MHIQYTATRSIQSAHTVSALVTDSTIDTACTVNWTCGASWAIASGTANHTAGSTAKFYQTITFTAGYVYNVTYDVIGPAAAFAGDITAAIGGTSGATTSNPDNTTTSVSETIIAGGSGSLLEFTPSSDFNGKIDNIYVSLTTGWSLYPETPRINPKYQSIIKQKRTDYGNTRTILRGYDKLWVITLVPITQTVMESDYDEFFHSVAGGETFTIDPYRASSAAGADNPVSVIMVGDRSISRESTTDYFTISFTVRVLPT